MNNERELEILHHKYITWFNNQTIHYQNHVYWIILQKILGNAKDLESSHINFDNFSKEKSECSNYQKLDIVQYMLNTRYAINNRADNNERKPFVYFLYPKKSIKMDETLIKINQIETISPIWVMPYKNSVSDYNEAKVCSINNQQRWKFNKGLFIIVAINDYYLEIGFNPDILKNFANLNDNEYISMIGNDKFCIDEKILNIFEFNGAKHIKYMKLYPLISNEPNYTYYAPPILQWENDHPFYSFDANILLKCSDIQPFLKIPEFNAFIKYLLNLNEEKVDEPNSPSNKIDKPYEKIIEKETDKSDKSNDKEESIEDCFKELLSHIDDKDIKIPKAQYMMTAKMLDCILDKFKTHNDDIKEFDKKFDELFKRYMK